MFCHERQCASATEIPYWWCKICPESGQELWMVNVVVTLFLAIVNEWHTKWQKATKVKCKRDKSTDVLQNSQYSCNIFLFRISIWASLTRERNIKSNKSHLEPYVGLLVQFCKHWFTSSVWNFNHWGPDISPGETSQVARSEEKKLFWQATVWDVITPSFH